MRDGTFTWYILFSHVLTLIIAASVTPSSTALPAPVSLPPTQLWAGNDGLWSTFGMQVGTPAQPLELLVSTSSNSIWPVLAGGCPSGQSPGNCDKLRATLFDPQKSSSWTDIGIYELVLSEEAALGYQVNASYGYDNVVLSRPGDPGMPTLTHQVIEAYEDTTFYVGSIGLSPHAVNISNITNPQPSFLGQLKNESKIPSATWAYTAGANYRQPDAFGSLTLGGMDVARFVPNDVGFTFASDTSRDLVVGLQSITSTAATAGPLLTKGIFMFLDSLVTDLWLPVEVCQKFEATFGIQYDNATERYLVNDTVHSNLQASNPNVTLILAASNSGGPTVNITMQYGSFDLSYESPDAAGNKSNYFPIRRAQNSTQYTLGRAFFQDAYVIADYDRGNFTVAQTIFPNTSYGSHIVAIKPPGYDDVHTTTTTTGSHKLSTGATAGIAVGVVIGMGLLIAGLAFYLLSRRRKKRAEAAAAAKAENDNEYRKAELDSTGNMRAEVAGDDATIAAAMQKDAKLAEISSPDKPPPELGDGASWPGPGVRAELNSPLDSPGTEMPADEKLQRAELAGHPSNLANSPSRLGPHELPVPLPMAELDGRSRGSFRSTTETGTTTPLSISELGGSSPGTGAQSPVGSSRRSRRAELKWPRRFNSRTREDATGGGPST